MTCLRVQSFPLGVVETDLAKAWVVRVYEFEAKSAANSWQSLNRLISIFRQLLSFGDMPQSCCYGTSLTESWMENNLLINKPNRQPPEFIPRNERFPQRSSRVTSIARLEQKLGRSSPRLFSCLLSSASGALSILLIQYSECVLQVCPGPQIKARSCLRIWSART